MGMPSGPFMIARGSARIKRSKRAPTLADLGERRIVQELIAPRFPPFAEHIVGIGDDCAVLPAPPPGHVLVMTTDPCPEPVICALEKPDAYHRGWLTVLINMSDLAAMGARPLGLLVSTVMPESMKVADYERFLDGLADASREWDCPVIGGNIKDGPTFTATGSALGAAPENQLMRRAGARVGDRIVVIGEAGFFWAAVLSRLHPEIHLDEGERGLLDRALYLPRARLAEGIALAGSGAATACMDSSDGIVACLNELALTNCVDLMVDSSRLNASPVVGRIAAAVGIDPRKLMLAWGDWQLVAAVRPEAVQELCRLMAPFRTPVLEIGEAREGSGCVLLREGDRVGLLANLASERFCRTSIFSHGLRPYLHSLRDQPLLL